MRSYPLRLSIALLCLGLLGACGGDESNLEVHLSRGDSYLKEAQFREAILEYKNVLQIDPKHGAAHWGLAQAYQHSGRLREAFWELRETARLDPNNLSAKIRFGGFSILAGDPEEALRQVEAVKAVDPNRADVHILEGRALQAMGRSEEALAAYEKALELEPDNVRPLHYIAKYHRQHGDRESAEPAFRRLSEVKPIASSYAALASFLADDRTRDAEAEATYRKALEVAKPDERELAISMLASFYFSRDRLDEAIEVVQEGIEVEEDPLDLIYMQARFYRVKGDEAKAEALIREATEARPDDVRTHLHLANYRASQSDWDGALEAATHAVNADPTDTEARVKQASMLVEIAIRNDDRERLVQGRSVAEAVLAEEPSNPEAQIVKAKVDLYEGRTDAAISQLRTAIDAQPDWAIPHLLLGMVLANQGEDAIARTELARALEIDPTLVEGRKALTQVHLRLRESEYAIEEGQRYLREKPDDVEAKILVAQGMAFLGQVEPALELLEAIPESDRDASVYEALGKLHMRLDQTDVARTLLLRAYEEKPDDSDILMALTRIDLIGGQPDEARARLQAAVEANPENADLRVIQGIFYLRQHRGEDAEPAFRRAIALDPENFAAYNHLARYYGRTGRVAEMIETYERALQTVPDDARLHYFLGLLYEVEGQREKAIARYEAAIEHDPNLAQAKNNLAFLLAASDEDLDRALDLAQEAKARMPDSPHAADTLGWVLYRRGIPSAAISYLTEAEAGFDPTSKAIGEVRYHLAMVYEAAGDPQNARSAATRALDGIYARKRSLQSQGAPEEAEPAWAAGARTLLARIPEKPSA
jgi:tetratricopeptide (TPR) repeat protein